MIEKSYFKKDEATKLMAELQSKFDALEGASNALLTALVGDELEKPAELFKSILKTGTIEAVKSVYVENAELVSGKGTPKAIKDERAAAVVAACENIYMPLLAELNTAWAVIPAELIKDPKISSNSVKFDRSNIEAYATAKNTLTMDARQQKAFDWLQKFGELVTQANEIFHPVFDLCRAGSFLESDLEDLSKFFNRSKNPAAFVQRGTFDTKVFDMTTPDFEKVHRYFDPAFYVSQTIAKLERAKDDVMGDYERRKMAYNDRIAELEEAKESMKGDPGRESVYLPHIESEIKAIKHSLKELEETKPTDKLAYYNDQIAAVKKGQRVNVY